MEISADHAVEITAGNLGGILVRMDDGTVFGWGYNPYGQLGTGDTNASFTPIQVPGINLN